VHVKKTIMHISFSQRCG